MELGNANAHRELTRGDELKPVVASTMGQMVYAFLGVPHFAGKLEMRLYSTRDFAQFA